MTTISPEPWGRWYEGHEKGNLGHLATLNGPQLSAAIVDFGGELFHEQRLAVLHKERFEPGSPKVSVGRCSLADAKMLHAGKAGAIRERERLVFIA